MGCGAAVSYPSPLRDAPGSHPGKPGSDPIPRNGAGRQRQCPLLRSNPMALSVARFSLAFSPFDLYPPGFDSILPGAERKVMARFVVDDRAQVRFPVFSPSVTLEPFRGSKGFAPDDVV